LLWDQDEDIEAEEKWLLTQVIHQQTVEAEFSRWLARPPNSNVEITMLEFWKAEADCMLRRVAMRAAGALMLSQCATERVNKLPKDVWTPKRMKLASKSVIRDVFLYANMDRLPNIDFDWKEDI